MRHQTRRAVSMTGLLYQRLKMYCEREELTCAGFVTRLIEAQLDLVGAPREYVLKPVQRRKEAPQTPAVFSF